jgi:hypothetical protein
MGQYKYPLGRSEKLRKGESVWKLILLQICGELFTHIMIYKKGSLCVLQFEGCWLRFMGPSCESYMATCAQIGSTPNASKFQVELISMLIKLIKIFHH